MTLEEAKESLTAYVRKDYPMEHFLRAVLAHDLFEAVGRADESSMANLKSIVGFIYSNLPGNCHGSYQHVSKWMNDPTDTSAWKVGDS